MTNDSSGDWLQDVRTLLAQGQKIEAIKLVRRQTNCGLKDAKEYVEALAAGLTPAVPTPSPAGTKAGCASVVALVVVLLALAASY
jgi:ribosomal protein L7/L12